MSTTKPKPIPPPRHGATPAEQQAYALAKLLANPDKPVHIPPPPAEGVKQLRAPREMMKNVQGSSAGAGSGEFHVYKQSRRREYERLKIMDEEEAFLKNKTDAERRQIEYQSSADAKTAKNRLKRQRKKAGRKGGKKGADGEEEEEEDGKEEKEEEGEGKKRKLGGGAAGGFRFKTAEERAVEDEAEAGEEQVKVKEREEVEKEQLEVEKAEEEVRAAKEAGIVIRDD